MKLWPHPLDDARPPGFGDRVAVALALAGTVIFLFGLVVQLRSLF